MAPKGLSVARIKGRAGQRLANSGSSPCDLASQGSIPNRGTRAIDAYNISDRNAKSYILPISLRSVVVIDGQIELETSPKSGGINYYTFWPTVAEGDTIMIGTWPKRADIHFIETYLWRTILSDQWLDEEWIRQEMSIEKPSNPQ